jgi:hypothetical protein
MGLDIRLPIGLMFTILGALLTGYGLISDRSIYQRALGININFWWGLVLIGFGVTMLLLGRRGTAAMRSTQASPEGQVIEEIEHATGLENESVRRGH